MRRLLATLIAAAMLTPAAASATCLSSNDGSAIHIAGLKSQLMVTALACDVRSRYNSFVLSFRPTLQREDSALNHYFLHRYGRSWRNEHDSYITLLANVQSDASIKDGTLFCQRNVGLFDQVMRLKSAKELIAFANDKPMLQPADFSYDICGLPHHPVYQPLLVQASAPTAVHPAAAAAAAKSTGAEHEKRGFFGNIVNGIASIF